MSSATFTAHHDKTADSSYRPSYEFGATVLGASHRAAPEAVRDIPGWLRDEDALKLYELAWFADGPVVEIGSYHGKATVVLAGAVRDAGSDAVVISLDVDPLALDAARRSVAAYGVSDRVVLVRGSARALFRAAPRLRPAMVFVDGDHSLRGVRRDLEILRPRVPDRALLVFHDYFDPRNADPDDAEVKVEPAVSGSWVAHDCEFAGVFGCCGLFRRTRGGPATADREPGPPLRRGDEPRDLPPLVDLVGCDDLRMRYLQRVRRPLGRWVRGRLGVQRSRT